jgi:palmitoyl-protein thioesterase
LLRILQKSIAPSSYWHDDLNEFRYRHGSTFLAILNNENHYNAEYVKNLQALKRLVLVKYINDISVIPNESTHFGYTDNFGRVIKLEDTELYEKDKLGLRRMKENGKLIMLTSPNEHLELDENWFRKNIIPILKEN